jgi:hypothetical protein
VANLTTVALGEAASSVDTGLITPASQPWRVTWQQSPTFVPSAVVSVLVAARRGGDGSLISGPFRLGPLSNATDVSVPAMSSTMVYSDVQLERGDGRKWQGLAVTLLCAGPCAQEITPRCGP